MKLIIGGAYQGKVSYAQQTYGIDKGWADGDTCSAEELCRCAGVFNFQDWIKRMLFEEEAATADSECPMVQQTIHAGCNHMPVLSKQAGLTEVEVWAETFAAWLYQNNPKLVIVSTELGCGVVPMEKKDRMWREAVGRSCTELAALSDEVVRVICGLGMHLKKVGSE